MKRILILAVLLLMVAPAQAQLNVKKIGEKAKQIATLNSMWGWLYTIDNCWYYVTKTSNQFDDNIWILLGDTEEGAVESIHQLQDLIKDMGEDDMVEITDLAGKNVVLTLYKAFGGRYGLKVMADGRAGVGYVYKDGLAKAEQKIVGLMSRKQLESEKAAQNVTE